MNSLSWLLYLINAVQNLGGFFTGMTVALFIALGIVIAIVHLTAAIHNDNISVYKTGTKISHHDRFAIYKKWIWVPFFVAFLTSFIPNERTMYLIAASEIGERIVSNEKVAGLLDPSIDILKNYVTLENEKIAKELKAFREKK